MPATLLSSTLLGIDSILVHVEVDVSNGIPSYHVVGLPDASVSESCERVRSALRNSGSPIPSRRVTVNLSPGDIRKEGPRFDLAIALGVLCADEPELARMLRGTLVLGELSLDGGLRPVRGVLSAAMEARRHGLRKLLVPVGNVPEARLVGGLTVLGVTTLRQAREVAAGRADPVEPAARERPDPAPPPDLALVKGQLAARRALEVAAAGSHHLVMVGPPGSGKTLLASCLPGLLPPLTSEEALEVTRIHSVKRLECGLITERPFRSPDPSVSRAGLLGSLLPGEVTLAHRGVLFLDEFPEMRRDCLEGLRSPLEGGRVAIARANFRAVYPARFTLVAAMNPCPCGYFGDRQRGCRCNPFQRQRYQGRFSGPLRDRIDLQVEVARLSPAALVRAQPGESTARVRQRVLEARERQQRRGFLNSQLEGRQLAEHCQLDDASVDFLELAVRRYGLSARVYDRVRRIARTLADLRASETVEASDLAEALEYRYLDRELEPEVDRTPLDRAEQSQKSCA